MTKGGHQAHGTRIQTTILFVVGAIIVVWFVATMLNSQRREPTAAEIHAATVTRTVEVTVTASPSTAPSNGPVARAKRLKPLMSLEAEDRVVLWRPGSPNTPWDKCRFVEWAESSLDFATIRCEQSDPESFTVKTEYLTPVEAFMPGSD